MPPDALSHFDLYAFKVLEQAPARFGPSTQAAVDRLSEVIPSGAMTVASHGLVNPNPLLTSTMCE
jgi:hypothetical protein